MDFRTHGLLGHVKYKRSYQNDVVVWASRAIYGLYRDV